MLQTTVRVIGIIACIVSIFSCSTLTPSSTSYTRLIELYYATDRNLSSVDEQRIHYGSAREQLTFGALAVALDTRDFPPELSTAGWKIYPAGDSGVVSVTETADLNSLLTTQATHSRTALIYVHGFGRDFDEVSEHFASLIYGINFSGFPILFSWPTQGSAAAYADDVSNATESVPHFTQLMKSLLSSQSFDTVHVVAHSLGNQIVLPSVISLTMSSNDWQDGELILLSPDIDRKQFIEKIAPRLNHMPSKVSLYVSQDDVPLKVSGIVNGQARLGDASDGIPVLSGIDTIDVSGIHTLLNAHSSYRKSPDLQRELHYLIEHRLSPENRPSLTQAADKAYWHLLSTSDIEHTK